MDVKTYFTRIRQVEQSMPAEFVIVSSLDTPDGGKSGVLTEVGARAASRLIVEQRARLATAEETARYRESMAAAARVAADEEMAERIQIKVVTDHETERKRPAK